MCKTLNILYKLNFSLVMFTEIWINPDNALSGSRFIQIIYITRIDPDNK